MWYNDYYKASSHSFGLAAPGDYRIFVTKHRRYLVVHSKRCKQCTKLPMSRRWTGPLVCSCGNPYINVSKCNKHINRSKEWRKVERKGLRDTVAAYRSADDALSTARLQDKWTQELQDEREKWSSILADRGINTIYLV